MNALPPVRTTARSKRFNTLRQIFAAPLALATLSSAGLVAALLGGEAWHLFSWAAIALPIVVCVVCIARGRS